MNFVKRQTNIKDVIMILVNLSHLLNQDLAFLIKPKIHHPRRLILVKNLNIQRFNKQL